MNTGQFSAGSWHVVRLPSTSSSGTDGELYHFYHVLMNAYETAGAPSGFEVYRILGPRSLYAYLSPGATSFAAEELTGKGFKLIPLREEFDVQTLPGADVDRVLPRA